METKKTIGCYKVIKCPICDNSHCSNLILDLIICDSCSHIFKKEPAKAPISASQLHKYIKPIPQLRQMAEKLEDGQKIMLRLPSLLFYTMELSPSKFYDSEQNHYFNQVSLMILLERCDLIPITQMTVWKNNIPVTCIVVEKNRVKQK